MARWLTSQLSARDGGDKAGQTLLFSTTQVRILLADHIQNCVHEAAAPVDASRQLCKAPLLLLREVICSVLGRGSAALSSPLYGVSITLRTLQLKDISECACCQRCPRHNYPAARGIVSHLGIITGRVRANGAFGRSCGSACVARRSPSHAPVAVSCSSAVRLIPPRFAAVVLTHEPTAPSTSSLHKLLCPLHCGAGKEPNSVGMNLEDGAKTRRL